MGSESDDPREPLKRLVRALARAAAVEEFNNQIRKREQTVGTNAGIGKLSDKNILQKSDG